MEVILDKNIDLKVLESLFTKCFDQLKDSDGDNFDESNDQEFRDWFGIDYLNDCLKFCEIILAREGENIVGGAIVGMQNPLSWPDGKKYELFILGVLPEYRSKGVGAMIMKKVEEISKVNGAESIILNTHELMSSTQRFYKNLGYTEMGTLKGYYGNGSAVFLMKKI